MDIEPELLGTTTPDGKYRFDELIGKGAFAHVYRVRHLRLDIDRALKVLHREWSEVGSNDIRNFRDRFEIEARLVARVHANGAQPHVIQVFDVVYDEASGLLYQEMEYAPGGSLASLIQSTHDSGEFVPLETVLRWLTEASSGLSALHKIDIVHRDVKPANILISADGKTKIADLGLAQTARSRYGQGSLAMDHPGTIEYMPPEQLPGQKLALRATADVYALGCVLFEALTGRIYYHHPGARVQEFRKDVPLWLDELTARCLAHAAADRPRDGFELADLLRKGSENQQVEDRARLRNRMIALSESISDAIDSQNWSGASQNLDELRLLGQEGQAAADVLENKLKQSRQEAEDLAQLRAAEVAAQNRAAVKRLQEISEKALEAGNFKAVTDAANQLRSIGPEGVKIAEELVAKVALAKQALQERARQQQLLRARQISQLQRIGEAELNRKAWNSVEEIIKKLDGLGPEGEVSASELRKSLKLSIRASRREGLKNTLVKYRFWWFSLAAILTLGVGLALAPMLADAISGQSVDRDATQTASAMNRQTYTALQAELTQTHFSKTPRIYSSPTVRASYTAGVLAPEMVSSTPTLMNTVKPTATKTDQPVPTNTQIIYPTKPPATNTPVPLPTNTPEPPDPTDPPPPTNTPVPQPTNTSEVRPPTPTPP